MPDVPGFTVLAELGRGAATVVYRVRHGGADWAMKVCTGSSASTGAELVTFRREAALLALAHHPAALPNVYEVGLSDGRPYLVMDFIEGRKLARTLSRGPLEEVAVRRLAAEVAQALSAAHRVGLVHRDVKPHNIIVQADSSVRLIDFGLAAMSSERSADTVVGTLAYAAPEQSGTLKRAVDARSDLYSLGVVLFECATRVPPSASADVGELLRMHATTPAPDIRQLRPELSDGLAAVIATLLAKDPDDRYQSGAALVADLRRLGSDPNVALLPQRVSALRAPHRVPLTGRRGELAELLTGFHPARAGRGDVVVVEGAQGSGRSRLLAELVGQVEAAGSSALCAPADENAPLAPLRRAVEGYVRALERMEPGSAGDGAGGLLAAAAASGPAAARLSPLLVTLGSLTVGAGDPAGSGASDRVVSELAGFIVNLARGCGGLLLCVDNADRVDGATRTLLAQAALEAAETPLLIVAGVYVTPVEPAADRAIFRPDTVGVRLALGALTTSETCELIRVGRRSRPR